jgi:ribulose-phosphate 3-epimerase
MRIAASILDSDFLQLGKEITKAENAGIDLFHLDVMDGHFVPNLSFGIPVIKALRPVTKLILESHLMVTDPETMIEAFARAGTDAIIFHIEATKKPERCLALIKSHKKQAGVALNPGTSVSRVKRIVPELDLLLLMSVWPGFGGQEFIKETFTKLREARVLVDAKNPSCQLAVDGGVNPRLAGELKACGVDIAVAGNAIFRSADYKTVVRELRCSAT